MWLCALAIGNGFCFLTMNVEIGFTEKNHPILAFTIILLFCSARLHSLFIDATAAAL